MNVQHCGADGRGKGMKYPGVQIAHLDDRAGTSNLIFTSSRAFGIAQRQGTGMLIRDAFRIAIDVPGRRRRDDDRPVGVRRPNGVGIRGGGRTSEGDAKACEKADGANPGP